ncbi:MAG TPA: single-stranded DNA-binding protein [Tepidiformaceae bacterium]|jgi:single-strand DNA-binding protein|nr:single-stranded DNA-binding protein [Tepidiformaceae bacterium]
MASLNKVMLIGNAGRDAELRYLATGTPQCQFSLAVNNRRRNQQSGEWEDQTEWFNIVIWGDTAERVSQYITKGKPLYIEGRLQTRSWDDDQGQKHYRTEVIAQNVQLLGSRDGGAGGGSGGEEWSGSSSYSRPRAGGASRGGDTDPDDLPFE